MAFIKSSKIPHFHSIGGIFLYLHSRHTADIVLNTKAKGRNGNSERSSNFKGYQRKIDVRNKMTLRGL